MTFTEILNKMLEDLTAYINSFVPDFVTFTPFDRSGYYRTMDSKGNYFILKLSDGKYTGKRVTSCSGQIYDAIFDLSLIYFGNPKTRVFELEVLVRQFFFTTPDFKIYKISFDKEDVLRELRDEFKTQPNKDKAEMFMIKLEYEDDRTLTSCDKFTLCDC